MRTDYFVNSEVDVLEEPQLDLKFSSKPTRKRNEINEEEARNYYKLH